MVLCQMGHAIGVGPWDTTTVLARGWLNKLKLKSDNYHTFTAIRCLIRSSLYSGPTSSLVLHKREAALQTET